MKLRMSKKGVDALISTVLLVGLTVSLVAMIGIWGKNYVSEKAQKEGILAEMRLKCQSMSFDVSYLASSGQSSVTARIRNTGAQNIDGFIFQAKGENDVQPLETTDIIRRGDARELTLTIDAAGIGVINSINIIPRIRAGKGTYVPCTGQHKEARVGAAA